MHIPIEYEFENFENSLNKIIIAENSEFNKNRKSHKNDLNPNIIKIFNIPHKESCLPFKEFDEKTTYDKSPILSDDFYLEI